MQINKYVKIREDIAENSLKTEMCALLLFILYNAQYSATICMCVYTFIFDFFPFQTLLADYDDDFIHLSSSASLSTVK